MKICIFCNSKFDRPNWQCDHCLSIPQIKNGFISLVENSTALHDSYDPEFFNLLSSIEQNHFWFGSRNRLICWAIQKYFKKASSFLEIGCGTGFVLSAIEKSFPDISLFGGDLYAESLPFASKRLKRTQLFQINAKSIPFESEFDLLGAFDILEHIQEDERVFSQFYKALKPEGGLILTVPQHMFLWSPFDVHSHHCRRYSAKDLSLKLRQAGFTIIKMTSFTSLLFPIVMLSRFRLKKLNDLTNPFIELYPSKWVNHTLKKMLTLERFLIRLGASFPLGSSLLVIAYKT